MDSIDSMHELIRSTIRTEVRLAVTEALREAACALKSDEYLNIRDMAERVGVDRHTLSRKLKAAGVMPNLAGRYSLKEINRNPIVSSRRKAKRVKDAERRSVQPARVAALAGTFSPDRTTPGESAGQYR